jgi:DNA-binding MarR family transcriptional regulator
MPQLRVLMLAATQAPLNLLTVAADLGVHPSNATRTCDRLVRAGLLDRRTSTRDRRHLAMTLTPAGRRLVDRVLGYRRKHVERLLDTMSRADRMALVRSLGALAEAAEADTRS